MTDIELALEVIAKKYKVKPRILDKGQYTKEGAIKRAEISRREAAKFDRTNVSKCGKLLSKALLDHAEAMDNFGKYD
jgi:hypothetical protein